jgi:hypothetical protein
VEVFEGKRHAFENALLSLKQEKEKSGDQDYEGTNFLTRKSEFSHMRPSMI